MSDAHAMRLSDLLAGFAEPGRFGDIRVAGLTLDSRNVRAGEAFVALDGTQSRGIDYASAAQASGASVVLAEMPGGAAAGTDMSRTADLVIPIIPVAGLRAHIGDIAARFFGEPTRALNVIGVTGTNGKTSIVQLLAQALDGAGHRVATIGTLGAGFRDRLVAGERTTPDAIALQGLFADFRGQGASDVAMEVSSHALAQGRVNGVAFATAVFTNLTHDHLDYHGTMQAYGRAKQRLFEWPDLRAAIINVDDAFGRDLVPRIAPSVTCLCYAIDDDTAEIRASAIESDASGLCFVLTTPWGEGEITSALLGRYNVANLLAVAACLGHVGVEFSRICTLLAQLVPIAGRMQRAGGTDALPLIVVDYAHTPDALLQALTSLRRHTDGRLSVVFGCGGERDSGKRPEMGAIAERLADAVIVTDDNPRGESGDAIVAAILSGMDEPQRVTVERDRAAAIRAAIGAARAGDVVLVAGKGHEPYQEVAGARRPFDDARVVGDAIGVRP